MKKIVLFSIVAAFSAIIQVSELFALVQANGFIPVSYRQIYYGVENAEVPYKVINTGNEDIVKIKIIVPSGFTFVSLGTLSIGNNTTYKTWTASQSGGVVTLAAVNPSDAITVNEYVSISIFVSTKYGFQAPTTWGCVISNVSETAAQAQELNIGDMKVSIIVLSVEPSPYTSVLLPGATTNIGAILLDDYGNPMENEPVNFSVISGNGHIISDLPQLTDDKGKVIITYEASSNEGIDRLQASFTNKTTAYFTIQVKDSTPQLIVNKIPADLSSVSNVKNQTGIELSCLNDMIPQYKIDEGSWYDYTSPITLTGSSLGYHTLYYRNKDANGKTGQTSSHRFFVTNITPDNSKLVNYPNPFCPGECETAFEYFLDIESGVTLKIYDLFGSLVWSIDIPSGSQGARANEWNQIFWNGKNLEGIVVANGGYIGVVTFNNNGKKLKRKVAVIK